MFNLSNQPQPVGKVIGDGFGLYGVAFFKMLPFSIIIAVLIILQHFTTYHHLEDIQITKTLPACFLWSLLSWGVVMLLVMPWLYAVMILQANKASVQTTASCDCSLLFALRKYLLYLIAGIICTIIYGIGIIFLVLPGIFLMLLLKFYMFGILLDNKGIFSSIGHSAKLVWKNWWRTFAVLIIPALVMIGLTITAVVVADMTTPHNPHIVPVAQAIITAIFIPLMVSFELCQYHDLKLRQSRMA